MTSQLGSSYLVHLSPAIISRQWKAPGNVWLLSTPKLTQTGMISLAALCPIQKG